MKLAKLILLAAVTIGFNAHAATGSQQTSNVKCADAKQGSAHSNPSKVVAAADVVLGKTKAAPAKAASQTSSTAVN